MQVARHCLADDGLFLLPTIGKEISTTTTADPFMTKYLFPGGNIPSIAQIDAAVEQSFVMEDWHLIGPDYDKTLMAWFENFDSGWDKLKAKYGSGSTAYGNTTCFTAPGPFAPGMFNFGKSFSRSMASPEGVKRFGEVR